VRSKLKRQFERWQITVCEMCGSGLYLGFAHRRKRRFITDDDELTQVALLCVTCHERIEHSSHEEMFEAITSLIEQRESRQ
jgi:hypothetical protein